MNPAERIDRRKLLKIGASIGLAAASGVTYPFLHENSPNTEDGMSKVITPQREQAIDLSLLPQIDINELIDELDWKNILSLIDYSRNHEVCPGGFSHLTYMISFVNQEKAQEIPTDEKDWKREKAKLDKDADYSAWPWLIPQAAWMRVTFQNRSQELYDSLENKYHAMIGYFSLYEPSGSTGIPNEGFELKNVLYPDRENDMMFPQLTWDRLTERLLSFKNASTTHRAITHLKHFAPERVPDYFLDRRVREEMRSEFIRDLHFWRDLDAYLFLWSAFDLKLLEANSVQMTPNGLMLS